MRSSRSPWTAPALALAALLAGGCVSVDLQRLLNPPIEEVTLREPARPTRNRVLLVDISGLIAATPGGVLRLMERCTPDTVRAVLDRARRDRRIRAVVLRIDTPGGTVAATDTIAHEIERFRSATGVPVIAALQSAACSGGYYIATSADRIWAHPACVTGSIGVIAVFPQVQGLTGKIGLGQVVIKTGDLKDMGSPLRDMKPEEQALIQAMLDDYYGQFLDLVCAARPRLGSREALLPLADGRVFSASQACANGLVDQVGHLDDAIDDAIRAAGLRDARVVTFARGLAEAATVYSATSRAPELLPAVRLELPELPSLTAQAGFHYLWLPGSVR
jgi:protease-4